MTKASRYRAVIFDLGGVVLGSPLHAIARYERERGLAENFVNRVVADSAPAGAWSRLERGELGLEAFFSAFEADCASAGQTIDARAMFAEMGEESSPRPAMLAAIARIREQGLRVGALTNNWASEEPAEKTYADLRDHFDSFVESSVVGLRKPDPRIYELACSRLQIRASEAVYLDDIGSNLKAARALGMTTLKVIRPAHTLAELAELLGFPLAG
jgi:putative hydrolase of the HAD superfamily